MDETSQFESHRSHLKAIAYRMLGSRAVAEDIVQDAWLRWHATERGQVQDTRAFLAQIVTRLCLDQIKSAQAQREVYTGTWLPEPLIDDESQYQPGPEAMHELANDLSYAFMLTLERLSPLERAAFLLHDVFDMSFTEVSATLNRSEAACRQLAARARANVQGNRPTVSVPREQQNRLAAAFVSAIGNGDVAALASVLAADARFLSDGGGRVTSVPYELVGRDLVAKVIIGFAKKARGESGGITAARINGLPGFVFHGIDGEVLQTVALEIDAQEQISGIYVMRNPDKLQGKLH